jgi:poly(hydroxyalkanoate) granule-associated protein
MGKNEEVNNEDISKENEKKDTHSFYYVVRRIMLAGVGAIALKHDELEELIDKLVERGEIAKKDGESLISEMKERRSKYIHGEGGHTHKKVNEFFDRIAVPTKTDLDALSEKISALEKKIDELSKSKK